MPFTEDDYKIYCAARAFGDLVFSEFAKAGGSTEPAKGMSAWLEDRRGESANPFYNQMHSGFVLEMYYGLPSKLYTPWGYWGFSGGASAKGGWFEALMETIIGKTDATLLRAGWQDDMGHHGPWYVLGRIGDFKCGPAVMRESAGYMPYDQARNIWAAMTARYNSEVK